jgi:hypothetical protein
MVNDSDWPCEDYAVPDTDPSLAIVPARVTWYPGWSVPL